MGYCMQQRGQQFKIKAENKDNAFQAIRNIPQKDEHGYSWVDNNYKNRESLEEALSDWRWQIEEDPNAGDICNIYFEGEKLGDDEILFDAIAPFVEAGSYVEMDGENGDMWRWEFDGEMCVENLLTITW